LVAISSSPPKKSFAASVALISRRNAPAPLAGDDDAADDAEVFPHQRGGEALHELGRLAELDLEDDGEAAVAAHAFEVDAGDGAELLDRIAQRGDAGAAVRDRLAHRPLEDRDEEVVLALEIEVDGAAATPAARATSATCALKKPRSAKTSVAARRIARACRRGGVGRTDRVALGTE
jgi:hypothetical protein